MSINVQVTAKVARVVPVKVGFGAPGPAGPPGAPGVASAQQYVAATALSALRLLTVDALGRAFYAEPGARAPVGVSLTAAAAGDLVTVAGSDHVVEDSAWTWTPGELVFADAGGVLTQVAPASGWWMPVGVAVSATRIVVRLQAAVRL